MFRQKYMTVETKVTDIDRGLVDAVVSTETKDRDGDVIRVRGWELERFMANPVLLSSHNYRSLTAVMGKWTDMAVKGKALVGTAQYYLDDNNAETQAGFKIARRGQAAFSVGFIPDMDKAKVLDDEGFWPTYEFNGQELLEVSQVTVPSNPEALQRMKGLGLHPVIQEMVDNLLEDEGPEKQLVEYVGREYAELMAKAEDATILTAALARQIADHLRPHLRQMIHHELRTVPALTITGNGSLKLAGSDEPTYENSFLDALEKEA